MTKGVGKGGGVYCRLPCMAWLKLASMGRRGGRMVPEAVLVDHADTSTLGSPPASPSARPPSTTAERLPLAWVLRVLATVPIAFRSLNPVNTSHRRCQALRDAHGPEGRLVPNPDMKNMHINARADQESPSRGIN